MLDVAGVTADTRITRALLFSFGTDAGDDIPGTPVLKRSGAYIGAPSGLDAGCAFSGLTEALELAVRIKSISSSDGPKWRGLCPLPFFPF